jgi:NAD(P)-dependent dehydrogenase (short-subunit alcohol dehydrogenase family)
MVAQQPVAVVLGANRGIGLEVICFDLARELQSLITTA